MGEDNDLSAVTGKFGAFEGRLYNVEATAKRHHEDIKALGTRVDAGFDGIYSKLDDMLRRRAENKTNWGVIISGVGVLVTILVLAFTPMIYMMQSNKTTSDIITQQLRNHELQPGHPALLDKANINAQAILLLDKNLQREMRDRDEIMETRLYELEKTFNIQFKEIMRRVANGEQWMDQHDKRVVGLNASQWERIKALERETFGQPGN